MLNNLVGGLKGLLGGGQQKQSAPAMRGYSSSLNLTDGDAAFNTAALCIALLGAAGTIRRLWEYTVPAQRLMRWGFGSPALHMNQGYIFFAFADAGTDICHGIVHLGYENHGRRNYIPIDDFDDARSHSTNATSIATLRLLDKNQMPALPEGGSGGKPEMVGQDSRLVIDYTTLVRATAEDIADFNIPCTIYE